MPLKTKGLPSKEATLRSANKRHAKARAEKAWSLLNGDMKKNENAN